MATGRAVPPGPGLQRVSRARSVSPGPVAGPLAPQTALGPTACPPAPRLTPSPAVPHTQGLAGAGCPTPGGLREATVGPMAEARRSCSGTLFTQGGAPQPPPCPPLRGTGRGRARGGE